MVSVCLPSDALLKHLPYYFDFFYLGRGVSLHGCSSKAQLLLLTLDERYLLTATLPDLQRGIAPLGPPMPAQPWLLGRGVAPPSCRPWPQTRGSSSLAPPPRHRTQGSSSRPFLHCRSLALSAAAPTSDWGNSSWPPPFGHGVLPASAPYLGRGVAPLKRAECTGHSRLRWVRRSGT